MRQEIEHILDQALDQLQAGASVEECLRAYPDQAHELEPVLRTAAAIRRQTAAALPPSLEQWLASGQHEIEQIARQTYARPVPLWERAWRALAEAVVLFVRQPAGRMTASALSALLIGFFSVLTLNAAAATTVAGEPLYPWKLFGEQVGLIFTGGPADRADYLLGTVETRVAELAELADRRGDPVAIQGSIIRLADQVSRISFDIAQLDPVSQADTRAHLARLLARAESEVARAIDGDPARARALSSEVALLAGLRRQLPTAEPGGPVAIPPPSPTADPAIAPTGGPTLTPSSAGAGAQLTPSPANPAPGGQTPYPAPNTPTVPTGSSPGPATDPSPSPRPNTDDSGGPLPTRTGTPAASAPTPTRARPDNNPGPVDPGSAPTRTPAPSRTLATPIVAPPERTPTPVLGPTRTGTPRTATPTRTRTVTPTRTPLGGLPQTATATRTVTPTRTPTRTPVGELPQTATATRTVTPTRTDTVRVPTATVTNTSLPATPTLTLTSVPPTPTQTLVPEPPTPTPTQTLVPEPPTPTPTQTLVPEPPTLTPTQTLVPEPPTLTPTQTLVPEPPTPTPTQTLVPEPPTPTPTQTLVPEPPTLTPTATTTSEGRLSPVFECVAQRDDGVLVAYFGYDNRFGVVVERPVGSQNRFTPPPDDRGQPTRFEVGRIINAFSVPFVGDGTQASALVWHLDRRTATANINGKRCNPIALPQNPLPDPSATPTQQP